MTCVQNPETLGALTALPVDSIDGELARTVQTLVEEVHVIWNPLSALNAQAALQIMHTRQELVAFGRVILNMQPNAVVLAQVVAGLHLCASGT
jgi:hypothetical protein